MISINKGAKTPVYQQVYEQIRDKILTGQVRAGDKLPPIRTLAVDLGISRNTVDSAYRQLTVEGYLESRQGSGFTVQPISQNALLTSLSGIPEEPESEPPMEYFPCDFRYGSLQEDSFPTEIWRRLTSEVLSEPFDIELSAYDSPYGSYELRSQIAEYLREERGLTCSPEQIVLTGGASISLELLLSMFDPYQDVVAMENPGFPVAMDVFISSRFQMIPIRANRGAQVYLDDIVNSGSRLVYTTPSHQFPWGDCLDMDTRLQLLHYAEENDAYIIEDDYDGEFRYNSQPVPPLSFIDQLGRVIYLGTFSKSLSPALRMSYMVLPTQLLHQFKRSHPAFRCPLSAIEQQTMKLFMERGHWKRHLHRTALVNKRKHDLLVSMLKDAFTEDEVSIKSSGAGLSVLINVNNDMTQEQLVASAALAGVGLTNFEEYWMGADEAPEDFVLLGFSAASASAIKRGIPQLRKAWFE